MSVGLSSTLSPKVIELASNIFFFPEFLFLYSSPPFPSTLLVSFRCRCVVKFKLISTAFFCPAVLRFSVGWASHSLLARSLQLIYCWSYHFFLSFFVVTTASTVGRYHWLVTMTHFFVSFFFSIIFVCVFFWLFLIIEYFILIRGLISGRKVDINMPFELTERDRWWLRCVTLI